MWARWGEEICGPGLTVKHVFDRMTVVEFAVEQLGEAIDTLAALDPDTLTDAELHSLSSPCNGNGPGSVPPPPRCWPVGTATAAGPTTGHAPRRPAGPGDQHGGRLGQGGVASGPQLASMPATAAAVAGGSLSLDHVDLLARANRPWRHAVFAEHEAILVVQCATLRFADAVRLVEYSCHRADAAAADDDAVRSRESARLHASTTIDGRVVINGELDPAGGAAVVGSSTGSSVSSTSPTSVTGSSVPSGSAGRRHWSRWPAAPPPAVGAGRSRCSRWCSVTARSSISVSWPTAR